MLGGLDGVGAVDDVAANLDAEVTTNGVRKHFLTVPWWVKNFGTVRPERSV